MPHLECEQHDELFARAACTAHNRLLLMEIVVQEVGVRVNNVCTCVCE